MARDSQRRPLHKITLSGKHGVGKTTLFNSVLRLAGRGGDATGVAEHKYSVPGYTYDINLHDTADMERHNSLSMGNYYRHCRCVVFVYDVTDPESLNWIIRELQSVKDRGYCDEETEFALLRNKIDVPPHMIQVSKEMERQMLSNSDSSNNILNGIETSGKDNLGVEKFFKITLLAILDGLTPVEPVDMFTPLTEDTDSCCRN